MPRKHWIKFARGDKGVDGKRVFRRRTTDAESSFAEFGDQDADEVVDAAAELNNEAEPDAIAAIPLRVQTEEGIEVIIIE